MVEENSDNWDIEIDQFFMLNLTPENGKSHDPRKLKKSHDFDEIFRNGREECSKLTLKTAGYFDILPWAQIGAIE